MLVDSSKEKDLEEKGYAIFDFLSSSQVQELTAFFKQNYSGIDHPFFATTHLPDIELRVQCSQFIKEQLKQSFDLNFLDAKLLGGGFIVKNFGKDGALSPHQDWNIVDEANFRSYNLWIPLVDVDRSNGTLEVLEGSHHQLKNYRGPGIPSQFRNIENKVWKHFVPLSVKAGQAVLYDHRLLHGSVASTDKKSNRLVVVSGVIPNSAEMICCFQSNNGIDVYQSYPSFYIEKNPAEGPSNLTKLSHIEKTAKPLSYSEFKKTYNLNTDGTFFQFAKKIFGA